MLPPLQVPGAIELVVILLIVIVPILIVGLVVGFAVLLRRRSGRLHELESRIEALETEFQDKNGD